jgi:Lrp/AsnC family leucine-responsive transcriptional regulator
LKSLVKIKLGVRAMNPTDLLVMSHFRNDARRNLTKISRETGIPVSTLYDKLKKFDGDVIKKFTSLIDFRKLGFDVRVTVMIKIDKEKKDAVRTLLMNNSRVNSLYRINNGYDFLVEGVFRHMNELEEFLEKLDQCGVVERKEYYIIDDLKREAFLSDPVAFKAIGL